MHDKNKCPNGQKGVNAMMLNLKFKKQPRTIKKKIKKVEEITI